MSDEDQRRVDEYMAKHPAANRQDVEDAMRRRGTEPRVTWSHDLRELGIAPRQSNAEPAAPIESPTAAVAEAPPLATSKPKRATQPRVPRNAKATPKRSGRSRSNRKPKQDPPPKVDPYGLSAELSRTPWVSAVPSGGWTYAALTVLARVVYATNHDGDEAPLHRIPTPENIGEWLPQCPQEKRAEADALLTALFGHLATWESNYHGTGAFSPLFALVRTAERQPDMDAVALKEAPGGRSAPMSIALPGAIHDRWREAGGRHPLAPIVADFQSRAPILAEWDDRRHPVMAGPLASRNGGMRQPLIVVAGDVRQLPLGFVGSDRLLTDPTPATLPGIEPVQPSPVPVLPIVTHYEAAGGSSLTRGRGAALPLRLFVEAVIAVPPELRRTSGPPALVTCTLRQLVGALWPRGWQRGRDWPRLMTGLMELSRLGIEWELPSGQGGVRFVVTVRDAPRDGARLDDVCRFEVLLPPGSGPGPMVDRQHLRFLGLDSAPAFRLYLALCWYWDRHGTYNGRMIGPTSPEVRRDTAGYVLDAAGKVVTSPGGRPTRRATHPRAVQTGKRITNPAALEQYPALSTDDLAVMAYTPRDLAKPGTALRRKQRQRGREALDEVAKMTSSLVLPAIRPDGVAGCVRVLPPPSHKAAHDAAFELRRDVNEHN